jgi:hypothetical protein
VYHVSVCVSVCLLISHFESSDRVSRKDSRLLQLTETSWFRRKCSTVEKSDLISLCLSAHPSPCLPSWNNARPTGNVFENFNIWDLY